MPNENGKRWRSRDINVACLAVGLLALLVSFSVLSGATSTLAPAYARSSTPPASAHLVTATPTTIQGIEASLNGSFYVWYNSSRAAHQIPAISNHTAKRLFSEFLNNTTTSNKQLLQNLSQLTNTPTPPVYNGQAWYIQEIPHSQVILTTQTKYNLTVDNTVYLMSQTSIEYKYSGVGGPVIFWNTSIRFPNGTLYADPWTAVGITYLQYPVCFGIPGWDWWCYEVTYGEVDQWFVWMYGTEATTFDSNVNTYLGAAATYLPVFIGAAATGLCAVAGAGPAGVFCGAVAWSLAHYALGAVLSNFNTVFSSTYPAYGFLYMVWASYYYYPWIFTWAGGIAWDGWHGSTSTGYWMSIAWVPYIIFAGFLAIFFAQAFSYACNWFIATYGAWTWVWFP